MSAMLAWIIAKGRADSRYIAEELERNQYTVYISSDREQPPAEAIDLCIDTAATGIRDVRRVLNRLGQQATHYILLSSCLVYPAVPRLFPWQEDMIDLDDAAGFSTLSLTRRRHRAAERELRHSGQAGVPWTILRPSYVESERQASRDGLWWMVNRILDGGPIVLPDGDEPLFSHVSDVDLARAILAVAGNQKAFFQTMNVTSPGFFSYDSYARKIMLAMNRDVPITRVPATAWVEANLRLPLANYLHSSFIADSQPLAELGWAATDDAEWLGRHVQHLVENPLRDSAQKLVERKLAKAVSTEQHFTGYPQNAAAWCITGQPGAPASVGLRRAIRADDTAGRQFGARYLAFGLAEESLLATPTRTQTNLVLGHNALLEVTRSGAGDPGQNQLFLPIARRPCGTPGCSNCEQYTPGVAGLTDDGFGSQSVNVAPEHLLSVDEDLGVIALLADPLACLLSVVPPLLRDMDGPVWVFGDRIEALLALLLVEMSGNPVLHISRNGLATEQLPGGVRSQTLARVRAEIRDGSVDKAGMFINCSGARDGENILGKGLAKGGFRITPYESTMPHKQRTDINYPLVAPGRLWLEKAMAQLLAWKGKHDMNRYMAMTPQLQPADMFIPKPFQMQYMDMKG